MLSHQPSNVDRPQRQHLKGHRRQQSTPTPFEARNTTTPFSPAIHQLAAQQQQRGMSLTHFQPPPPPPSQDDLMVGITNPGQPQQHYLQEAQHYSQARPGPQQEQAPPQQQQQIPHIPLSADQFRELQHQQLDAQLDSFMHAQAMQQYEQTQSHFVKIERTRSNPEPRDVGAGFVELQQNDPIAMHQEQVFGPIDQFHHSTMMARPASSQSNAFGAEGIMALQPNCYMPPQRPFTPPTQVNLAYFPATPAVTPFSVNGEALIQLQQQQQYALSQSQSPDPSAPMRGRSLCSRPNSQISKTESPARLSPQAVLRAQQQQQHFSQPIPQTQFFEIPAQDGHNALPSPPNTAPTRFTRKFDAAMMPNAFDSAPHFRYTPVGPQDLAGDSMHMGDGAQHGLGLGSVHSSPIQHYQEGSLSSINYDLSVGGSSSPFHSTRSSVDYGKLGSPDRGQLSPGTMSIADLTLEAAIEDTGISAEEVQAYISEQDVSTGKWTCLFPECDKVFGRKENIRSHVQTHLGDRQYRCMHCQKRFVRQHDLKRHAKIHSGVKPYPCRCGNSFARHDALTRHRQRGICDGGFEGIVKKIVKRGRPRKERPTDDDRVDKAALTRKKAAAKSYASSVSGTSESGSYPESMPSPSVFSGESGSSNKTLQQTTDEETQAGAMQIDSFSYTPPSSPYSISTGNSPAKSLHSRRSGSMPASPASPAESKMEPDNDVMSLPLAMEHAHASHMPSQAGSPPELSHSSPPSSTRVKDLEIEGIFASSLRTGTSGEAEAERAEAASSSHASQHEPDGDFDMFNLPDNSQSIFGGEWDESAYFSFDKDAANALRIDGFGPTLEDESLFSDARGSTSGFSW